MTFKKLVQFVGLGEIAGGPQPQQVLDALAHDIGAHHDHGNVTHRGIGFEAVEDFVAGHIREI